MTTIILAILFGIASIVAMEIELRRERKGHAAEVKRLEFARRISDDDHAKAFATLNEELEQMRTRALLAERRVRSDEAPLAGAIKVRSASALRALNDQENERVLREGAEKNANTYLRTS